MRHILTTVLLTALVSTFALPAAADYIGNPVKGLNAQQPAVEAAISEDTLQFAGDYAISEAGTVQGRFGTWDTEGVDGTVLGGAYFHTLPEAADLDGKPVHFAAFGMHRIFSADESGVEFELTSTLLGAGATIEPAERLHLYALGALELWEAEATAVGPFGNTFTASDDGTNIGIAVGGEFELAERLKAGAEIQAGFENDDDQFSLFARFAF